MTKPVYTPQEVVSFQLLARNACYLIVASMFTVLAVVIKQAGETIFIGWQGGYFPWIIMAASLEAMYAQNLLHRRGYIYLDREFWYFRAAEWIVYFVSLRSIIFITRGVDAFLQEIARWQEDWLTFFYDPELLVILFVTAILWSLSGTYGEDIDQLQVRPADVDFDSVPEMELDRKSAKARITRRTLSIGIVLVAMTLFIRLNVNQVFDVALAAKMSTGIVLVYFGLAVILLSLTEYTMQYGRWLWERIPLGANIARRWLKYAIIFLGTLIFLSLFLPTVYTIGLLDTIRFLLAVMSYLAGLVVFFFTAIFSLLALLYYRLVSGFSETPAEANEPLSLPQFNLDRPMAVDATSSPLMDALISGAFWITLLFVVVVAFGYYLRQNSDLFKTFRNTAKSSLLRAILDFLTTFFQRFSRAAAVTINKTIGNLRQGREQPAGLAARNYIGLRKLSAREKIQFYYLALLRRGDEAGVGRRKNQTPRMYRDSLRSSMPEDLFDELELLTEQFQEARYSSHTIDDAQANIVRRAWQHLRGFFHDKNKQEQS